MPDAGIGVLDMAGATNSRIGDPNTDIASYRDATCPIGMAISARGRARMRSIRIREVCYGTARAQIPFIECSAVAVPAADRRVPCVVSICSTTHFFVVNVLLVRATIDFAQRLLSEILRISTLVHRHHPRSPSARSGKLEATDSLTQGVYCSDPDGVRIELMQLS